MSKEWYKDHHSESEDDEFLSWWDKFYGSPEDYSDEEGEQDEYWVRKGFALKGWIASKQHIG